MSLILGWALLLGIGVSPAQGEAPLLPEKLELGEPWRGVRFEGAVLTLTRVERFAPEASCEPRFKAFKQFEQTLSPSASQEFFFKPWQPLDSEDLEDIEGCVKNPCGIKLNDVEVAQLRGSDPSKDVRQRNYLSLVTQRVSEYQRSGSRKGYEFPGEPVDPWKKVHALSASAKPPTGKSISFEVRALDFAPGKIRVIRQVLDSRVQLDRSHGIAQLWKRDVYTNHYFDSWGEWIQLECTPGKKMVLTQVLVLEFDLLKKTDFFSGLMQGGMKSTLEENGVRYLNQGAEKWGPVKKGLASGT